MQYYREEKESVMKSLDTNENGLTKEEAEKRLERYGRNVIENKTQKSKLSLFLSQFDNMMIKMLIVAGFISLGYSVFMKEPFTDSLIMFFIVFLNALMGFFQEAKAEAEVESLKKINHVYCKVKRAGKIYNCNAEKLVPGDIILLDAGNKIPADARILNSYTLKVNESLLTGESEPVLKSEMPIAEEVLINDRKNMIYAGCDVLYGRCIAVVTETGMQTELGKIASALTDKKDVPTPLQRKIEEISKKLTNIILVIIAFVFLYNLFYLKNDLLDVVILSISLLVSAIPEGLPTVITICLSIGTHTMASKNTIVRTLSSVETLGSVEVVCSDKTGTITQNQMTVMKLERNSRIFDEKEYSLLEQDSLINGMILCNDSEVEGDHFLGDPTETALLDYAQKRKIDYQAVKKKHERIADIPFDSERKMMSTIHRYADTLEMYSKGSLESILNCSTFYLENGQVYPLPEEKKIEFRRLEESMSENALRVIGFAYREVSSTEEAKEENLIFVGMVGMIDPPRKTVKDSIRVCKESGIIPIMITGDSLKTAMAIAKDIGLATSSEEGIEGKSLANYSDLELDNMVLKYRVYARVSPDDKVRIVKALERNGKVVAMTGDGVNDAPAIKLAHVGIGMGASGTEVTKSVADILLLDDCFSTIITAIEEGRRIFNNIRNVIVYSLSSNFAEIFIVVAGMFLSVTALLPIHILFINLVTDTILAICLAFEKGSPSVMKEPPRKSTGKFFTPFITSFLIVSAVIECILIFIAFLEGERFGLPVAQSMAFLCLIVQEAVFAFNCRNLKEPVYKQGLFSNKYFNIGTIALIIVHVLIFVTPIRSLLQVTQLTFEQFSFLAIINLIAFLGIDFSKIILRKIFKDA